MKQTLNFLVVFLLSFIFSPLQATPVQAKPLEGQTAIVWGASQGIGKAIAKDLASKGAMTHLIARSEDKLLALQHEIAAEKGTAEIHIADITKEEQVERTTNKILAITPKVDILVQNVGIYPRSLITDMSADFLRNVIETNLISSFNTVKAILPTFQQQHYGRIILVSSITGPKTGIPGLSAYGASKAAMQGFIKSAAIELAQDNITINAVEPGYTKTEGLDHLGVDYFNKVNSSVPLGRMGEPREIAQVVSFLASPESSYVTGTSIVIDGGLTLPESHYLHVMSSRS